jgi:Flp pilus assembly CpaF family ATPase
VSTSPLRDTTGADPTRLPLWLTAPPESTADLPDLTVVPPLPEGSEHHRPTAQEAPTTLDWALVRALRARAANELAGLAAGVDERGAARRIVTELVAAHTADTMTTGQPALTSSTQQALVRAVIDSLLGLGRLQPLVDDPEVENIEVTGSDPVTLVLADGRIERAAPVADTDDELIELLQHIGSRATGGARPFSHAHPQLHLELPGGARLAAAAWVTRRPAVVIRLHRLSRVTLNDLVQRGSLEPAVAALLAAAVRARCSIVLSGAQGVGKTTLLRALAAEIDPWERIGTLETERELHLHATGRHHRLVEFEARPGSGERTPDGSMAGEISLGDLTYGSFRFNLERFIVGEVRGWEVLAMFRAMQTGAGSMSTTHATSARAAIERLVTCAMEAGAQTTADYAYRQVAAHIRLIVQLGMAQTGPATRPTRTRFVTEVIAVEPGEDQHPATTTLWRRDPRTGQGQVGVLPGHLLEQLTPVGFDPTPFLGSVR